MKIWIPVLFLVLFALPACEAKNDAVVAANEAVDAAPANFTVVKGKQARDLVTKGAKLVDVRTPGEFASGHIEGAVNIPVQDLGARLGELDKAQATVVYCASGARSSAAMGMMKNGGFAQVYDLGGKSNW